MDIVFVVVELCDPGFDACCWRIDGDEIPASGKGGDLEVCVDAADDDDIENVRPGLGKCCLVG